MVRAMVRVAWVRASGKTSRPRWKGRWKKPITIRATARLSLTYCAMKWKEMTWSDLYGNWGHPVGACEFAVGQ